MIQDGAINVDAVALPGIDVVHNLDDHPWPFADASATRIRAAHIFEHVADPVGFMCEAWRVLGPGGHLDLIVPHWKHRNAYTDPTHRRYCTEDTFRYWVPGTWLHDVGGDAYTRGFAHFDEITNTVRDGTLYVTLRARL